MIKRKLLEHSDQYFSMVFNLQKESIADQEKLPLVILKSYEYIDKPQELNFMIFLSLLQYLRINCNMVVF